MPIAGIASLGITKQLRRCANPRGYTMKLLPLRLLAALLGLALCASAQAGPMGGSGPLGGRADGYLYVFDPVRDHAAPTDGTTDAAARAAVSQVPRPPSTAALVGMPPTTGSVGAPAEPPAPRPGQTAAPRPSRCSELAPGPAAATATTPARRAVAVRGRSAPAVGVEARPSTAARPATVARAATALPSCGSSGRQCSPSCPFRSASSSIECAAASCPRITPRIALKSSTRWRSRPCCSSNGLLKLAPVLPGGQASWGGGLRRLLPIGYGVPRFPVPCLKYSWRRPCIARP